MLGLGAAAMWGALSVGPAVADAPQVILEWTAPVQCPRPETVRVQLAAALSDSHADPRGMRARATVTERSGGGLVLELSLTRPDGPVGQRTMEASDCDELAKAAVLIMALAIDPNARVQPAEVAPPTSDVPGPTPAEPGADPSTRTEEKTNPAGRGIAVKLAGEEPATDTPPPDPDPAQPDPKPDDATTKDDTTGADDRPRPTTPPAPRQRLHVDLRAQGAAGISVLPTTVAAVSLMAGLAGHAWRVELGGTVWTPAETTVAAVGGGRFWQWTVDVRGCGVLRPGPLEVPLCGGVDVGAVNGQGIDLESTLSATALRLAASGGAALVWRPAALRRVGLWIGGDALLALVRARFSAFPAADGLLHHTPRIGGRAGAGIEVRFR